MSFLSVLLANLIGSAGGALVGDSFSGGPSTVLPPPQETPVAPAPVAPAPPAAPGSSSQGVPPAAPQEQDQRSPTQALDDLLHRLSAERPATTPVGPETPFPLPTESPSETIDPATRLARLTRTSDAVQVVLADGRRRDLEFWDKELELAVGDEVRQGAKSCAIVDYADGAHYRFDGQAIWRMQSDALAVPRQLEIVELARTAELYFGGAGIDTVLTLPGGNQLAGRASRITLRDHDQRALEIRDTGPEPVVVRSPYLGERTILLQPGQGVFLPVLAEPAAFVRHLVRETSLFDEQHGRLRVQAPEQIALGGAGEAVELTANGTIPGIARACGARVVLAPGETIRLTRVALGYPRNQEWDD